MVGLSAHQSINVLFYLKYINAARYSPLWITTDTRRTIRRKQSADTKARKTKLKRERETLIVINIGNGKLNT